MYLKWNIFSCLMKTHPSSDVHSRGQSKAVENFVIYIYYLGQMQCFCTKNSILVTQFTHDVMSTYRLRYSHFGRIQKRPKSRLNVCCLPVDPLSFRHNFDSRDATPNISLTRTMSLCKHKY